MVMFFLALFSFILACKKSPSVEAPVSTYTTTPYSIKVPKGFPQPNIPADNPMTVEGVTLGRFLFYDSILSYNYKQSCASCHRQQFAFSNGNVQFSKGADGISIGDRNAPALFNKAWDLEGTPPYGGFFWDGRAKSLEDQALMPLVNPKEMALSDVSVAVTRLQSTNMYPDLFKKAFGSSTVTKENIGKAIAQFMRIIVSGNSLYDSVKNHILPDFVNSDQKNGYNLFIHDPIFKADSVRYPNTIEPYSGLDCFHCHAPPFFTPDPASLKPFMNNGLTGINSSGDSITLFKVPSVRNVLLTAPFMHDGEFANLDSVIAHYDHGYSAIHSPYLSDFMFYKRFGKNSKMKLTPNEIKQVKAFLASLTDYTLITNPEYKNPFLK